LYYFVELFVILLVLLLAADVYDEYGTIFQA